MTIMPSVRLITSSDFPDLHVDDQELLVELRARGIPAEAAVWDDPDVDWSQAPLCVVRSVYDYHLRREEFLDWVDRVSAVSALMNDPGTLRWNSHKSYLDDLASAGFPVIETCWVSAGQEARLRAICGERGWSKGVVKPAVSASAYETLAFDADQLDAAQAHLERLSQVGDVMVQPYVDEIDSTGESSLIWLGGRRTHAARRPSGLRSSLVEARLGAALVPRPDEVKLATAIFESIDPQPLYARIDLITTARWGLLLLELELIEPALYLRHSPAPVIVFADAIERELSHLRKGAAEARC